MSEQEFDPNKEVEVIPHDAVVTIEVSGTYYARVIRMIAAHGALKKEEMGERLQSLEANAPKDEFDYSLITMLTLSKTIEDAAKDQGKLETTTVGELNHGPQGDVPGS
jgi:hypothetical protein